jgi:hypothetical protein
MAKDLSGTKHSSNRGRTSYATALRPSGVSRPRWGKTAPEALSCAEVACVR